MTYLAGKVLVTMDFDGGGPPHVRVLTCNSGDPGARDEFKQAVGDHIYVSPGSILSRRQRRFKLRATVTIALTCCVEYTRDYWGEWDSELVVTRRRTLGESVPTARQIKRLRA